MKTGIGVVLALVVVCAGTIGAKAITPSGWVSDEAAGGSTAFVSFGFAPDSSRLAGPTIYQTIDYQVWHRLRALYLQFGR